MEPSGLIEVFTKGCSSCEPMLSYAQELAASGRYDLRVWNASGERSSLEGRERMRRYSVHELPAIVVDGKLLGCCGEEPK